MTFDYLQQQIKAGNVRLTLVISPPRCGSTAIAHAISRSPSYENQWYVHEPRLTDHGYSNESWEQSLKHHVKSCHANPDSPLHVTMKLMSHNTPPDSLDALVRLASSITLLTRDPLQQITSFLKLNEGEIGIKEGEIKATEEGFTGRRFDRPRHQKTLLESTRKNQISKPWEQQANLLAKLTKGMTGEKLSVLDGDATRLAPEVYLKILCQKAGLEFAPSMLQWSTPTHLHVRDNWSTYFKTSNGLEKPIQRTIPTPKGDTIIKAESLRFTQTYAEMLCHPSAIKPALLEDAITTMEEPMADGIHPYRQASPIAAYAMIASYNPRLLSDGERHVQSTFLREVRENTGQNFSEYFDVIDSVIEREFGERTPAPTSPETATCEDALLEGSCVETSHHIALG